MKVRKDKLTLTKHCNLRSLGLLYLHDELSVCEYVPRLIDELGAVGFVITVANATAEPGPLLNQDSMARLREFLDSHWQHACSILVVLDFLGYANDHTDNLSRKCMFARTLRRPLCRNDKKIGPTTSRESPASVIGFQQDINRDEPGINAENRGFGNADEPVGSIATLG